MSGRLLKSCLLSAQGTDKQNWQNTNSDWSHSTCESLQLCWGCHTHKHPLLASILVPIWTWQTLTNNSQITSSCHTQTLYDCVEGALMVSAVTQSYSLLMEFRTNKSEGLPVLFIGYCSAPCTIDIPYVDGVSITHGASPRKHIWTYAAGLRGN